MAIAACLACSQSSSEEEAMSVVLGLTAGHKTFITKQLHDSQKRFIVIEQMAYSKQVKHRLWLMASLKFIILKCSRKCT